MIIFFVDQNLKNLPLSKILDIEQLNNFVVQTFLVKDEGYFVNMVNVFCGNNFINTDIAKEGNFRAKQLLEEAIALDPKYGAAYSFLGVCHWFDARRRQ